jgi:hypothetical protein
MNRSALSGAMISDAGSSCSLSTAANVSWSLEKVLPEKANGADVVEADMLWKLLSGERGRSVRLVRTGD